MHRAMITESMAELFQVDALESEILGIGRVSDATDLHSIRARWESFSEKAIKHYYPV